MPIYEYRCRHCENSFEELVLSSNETIACLSCASPKVERQLSVFSSPEERVGKGEVAAAVAAPRVPAAATDRWSCS